MELCFSIPLSGFVLNRNRTNHCMMVRLCSGIRETVKAAATKDPAATAVNLHDLLAEFSG
jgi:hypothetical protein